MKVPRKKMTLAERAYLPEIARGLTTTIKHALRPGDRVTRRYPEEGSPLPERYRGVPALVADEDGRMKCVACQLCEFVCPSEAIKIVPAEYPESNVEKYPARFDLNMLRCIYCGLCEEACPRRRSSSATARRSSSPRAKRRSCRKSGCSRSAGRAKGSASGRPSERRGTASG